MAEHAVQTTQLVKRYGRTTAVDGIDLDIATGETFGILGVNGAGKSTLVSLVAGLVPPTSGEVRVLGRDPRRERLAVRHLLGVQLQDASLHHSLTVAELIDLYRSFYPAPRDAEELLAMVALESRRHTRFADLSGGQQQRLSVALALIGRPQVLIFDELTTGLDPRGRRHIWSMVEALDQETVLLVSHAMDEVERLCDRVALIDRGTVIALGTPREVTAGAGANTLEEAFVALTGHQVEDDSDEEEIA